MQPAVATDSASAVTTAQREALTMALYACIVLTAEFVGMGDPLESARFAIGVIWGTTVGLTLAHIFAFDLAARAFAGGPPDRDMQISMAFQVGAGVVVAAALTLPFLVLRPSTALRIDGFLTAAFIGLIAYGIARTAGRSFIGAVGFGLVILLIAVLVVALKNLLSYH